MTAFPSEVSPKVPAPIENRPLKRRPAKKLRSGSELRNIWILDDDESMCALLQEQFQIIGCSLKAFHRSHLLLEALQEDAPDLLILDLLLPDKHGIDVLSRVRQSSKGLPVLVLSALTAPGDRVLGLEAGADDYLIKPFQFRELQLRSERLLRRRRLLVNHDPQAAAPPVSAHPLQGGSYQLGPLRLEVDDQPHLVTADGASHRLGRGDGALLLAFCRHPHQVLSRAQLLQASGSLVSPGQTRTIDVRLSRLRRLLRNLTGTDLILPERGQGYKLNVEVRPLGDAAKPIPRS